MRPLCAEHRSLLLRLTDEDDPFPFFEAGPHLFRDVVLALALQKRVSGICWDSMNASIPETKVLAERYPRPTAEKKLREKIREATPRSSGTSLDQIIKKVNLTLRGW